jgi:hypothetical protein
MGVKGWENLVGWQSKRWLWEIPRYSNQTLRISLVFSSEETLKKAMV